jgi:hypothetical protein
MLINTDTQERVICETTVGAGTTTRDGSIKSDSLIATLWINSITSGSLTVSIYTLTDTGKEILLFSFPTVSAPSVSLLLKGAGVSMMRFRVEADYTGIVDYEVYVRAVSGIGTSTVTIESPNDFTSIQTTVGTTATLLIPASLMDRSGIVIKNWSTYANVYVAETLLNATIAAGYPLAPRDALALDIAAGAALYIISDSAGADIRIMQAGG